MSANGSPGSSKKKMNFVDKPVTVLYADGVKNYEELAKRGSSAVFYRHLWPENWVTPVYRR
jgi:hypothetical protein